jgi:predicted nucleotidyltransferase
MYVAYFKRKIIREIIESLDGENVGLSLFGSVVSDTYDSNRCRPQSDIDLCVKTDSGEVFDRCFKKITKAVDGRSGTDIIWWNAVTDPCLKNNIRKGILLKEGDRICF